MISLFTHQQLALNTLHNGCVLRGDVGSGKSITALAYYYIKVSRGSIDPLELPKNPMDLIVITIAKKRDSLDWENEARHFGLSVDPERHQSGISILVDSWNNIAKYTNVEKPTFFIFDEQKAVGKGVWAKSFIKIAKRHPWIMLSATPADSWKDLIPVFLANGFYKNRTQFNNEHVIFAPYSKFPVIKGWRNEPKLVNLRRRVIVEMGYKRHTVQHIKDIYLPYDKQKYDTVAKDKWNVLTDKPIASKAEGLHAMRRVVNSQPERLDILCELLNKHKKIIVFYNFNYELDLLRSLDDKVEIAQYNGFSHDPLPQSDRWLYLVQYMSGAEAWECIETNTMVFWSLNYSYRVMTQSRGRIDRLNTPYTNLYYYRLQTKAPIDMAIANALRKKQKFNEKSFDFEVIK